MKKSTIIRVYTLYLKNISQNPIFIEGLWFCLLSDDLVQWIFNDALSTESYEL